MKHLLLILVFISFSNFLHAMGISDWYYKTTNGTTLEDPGNGTHLRTNHTSKELFRLTKWYYYKNHIIGEYDNFSNNYTTEYFILNELNGEFKIVNNKKLFENDIKTRELVPQYWTRWYTQHSLFIETFFTFCLFYLPLIILLGIIMYSVLLIKNKIINRTLIVLTATLIIPIMLFMLNDYYINSI